MRYSYSCEAIRTAITSIANKYHLDLTKVGTHIRLDMPHFDRLCIEVTGPETISVAHYFVQHGDLMADPEIVFWVSEDKTRWVPIEWTHHPTGNYQYYVVARDPNNSNIRRVRVPQGIIDLARMWGENIDRQGWLQFGDRYWRKWRGPLGYYRAFKHNEIVYSDDSLIRTLQQFAPCERGNITIRRADDTIAWNASRCGIVAREVTKHRRIREERKRLAKQDAEPEGESFSAWMKRVDACIAVQVGLVSNDLADQLYRDWFDAGYSPRQAAQDALANEGFDTFV